LNRRTEQEWRQLFSRQEQSGLSAAQFCRENNLCNKHFSKRRKELQGESKGSSKTFVPVQVARPQAVDFLHIRYGRVEIQLPCTMDVNWLAALVQQLQA
jgi:hypothetical protein